MAVREVDPHDKRELNRFTGMERGLLGAHPLFVGELLDSDVRKRLSGKSAFSQEMSSALFWTEQRSLCRDREPAVAAVERRARWLAARGMTRVIAPLQPPVSANFRSLRARGARRSRKFGGGGSRPTGQRRATPRSSSHRARLSSAPRCSTAVIPTASAPSQFSRRSSTNRQAAGAAPTRSAPSR